MTKEEAIELIESARKTMYLPKSKEYISDFGYALEMAIKALEQEPKAGHWKRNETIRVTYCSECGFGQYIDEYRTYNYCPNCGAKMESEEEA